MKPFLNKFLNIFHFRRQTAFFAVLGAVFVLGFLILPHSAGATVQSLVGDALAFVFGLIFKFLGGVILKFILDVLVQVAQYNGIINIEPVRNAWTTVRDIVNMFFIFAMLLIAFSTILRIHQYEAKQLLPKLVLYAILVNFSLTICGLFIDLAQVFTLTFVNAFANGAVNNFTQITGVLKYGELGTEGGTTNITDVLGGYMLALILLLVTIVTIGAMLLMFLVRIVYLWVLSILSPFAFVLPVVPGGQGYASQWWTMFSKQVVTAPLLAFFIWLSLTIMSQTGISNKIINESAIKAQNLSGVASATTSTGVDGSAFLINYIIAICMMFVGLMLTSQMGGAAGKIAGGASNWMQRSGTGLLTGRIGPTPMRWARERYQSYRGQREGIRKESAQRFGQGVSAIQDRQISSRISGLVRGTAGQVTGAITGGRWVAGENKQRRAQQRATEHWEKQAAQVEQTHGKAGDFANQTHDQLRVMYQQEQSQSARAAIASELNRRGELGRQVADQPMIDHAMTFLRQHSPEAFKKFDDTQRTNYAKHLTALNDEQVRTRFATAAPGWQQAAIGQDLNQRGALGRDEGRDTGIELATRQYLERETPDALEKFNDTMKIKNAQFAFDKVYRDRATNDIDVDRVISDLNSGKLRGSSLTSGMLQVLDAQVQGRGGSGDTFGNQWARSMIDPKEIKSKLKDMEDGTLNAMASAMNVFDQSLERRTAFGEASGHWNKAFDVDNTDAHTAATAENEYRNFMSYGKNRKMYYEDGSEDSLANKSFLQAIHSNKQYGATESQLKAILDDPRKKAALDRANSSIINDANTTQNYSEAADRARNIQIKISGGNALKDNAGKPILDSAGEPTLIYDINNSDLVKSADARDAYEKAVKSKKVRAENFTKHPKPTNPNDFQYKILSFYNDDEMAKIAEENRDLTEGWIKYLKSINDKESKARLAKLTKSRAFSSYTI